MDRKVFETRLEIGGVWLILCVATLLFPTQAGAQQPTSAAAGVQQTGQGAGVQQNGQAASTQPAPAATTTDSSAGADLLSTSLPRDIATASYYELVAWARQLGLDDAGSRHDLQVRLATHFSVTLPPAVTSKGATITVRSARESRYYTLADSQEKYAQLDGDVVVEVSDTAAGTLQVVKAASITFNQTRRTITAKGGVSYALTRGGQTDTFSGESLSFNIDTSEAVFYDGSTKRTIKQNGTDIAYTFKGDTMTRRSDDVVILSQGSLTSSDVVSDPYYQVQAQSIWLLAPGEWAIQNALLLLGRVPILYFPGFFWPGDDFIFNPNFGFDSREGSYLQTTTYLLGQKAKQDSALSFLQISDSGDSGYSLEPNGLFLRKVPGSTTVKNDGHFLKLMLDGYTRLGGFIGLAGDYSPLATFRAGIGVTRSLFYDSSTSTYTPFMPTPAPGYQVGDQFWNSSSLFGTTVPFRYGLDGTFKTSGDIYSVTGSYQFFSDPSFTTDFYTRSEASLLSSLLNQATTSTAPTTTSTAALQSNLSWNLDGRLDFTKLVNLPIVSSLVLQDLNLKATWLSSTPAGLTEPASSDPGSTFYYPSSITAPDISFSLAGDLLSLGSAPQTAAQPAVAPVTPNTGKTTAPVATGTNQAPAAGGAATSPVAAPGSSGAAAASAASSPATSPGATTASTNIAKPDPGKGFRTPFQNATEVATTEAAKPHSEFRSPTDQPDSKILSSSQGSTLKVSYQIQPRATLDHTFDTTNWTSQSAVDYAIRYRTFETGGTGALTAASTLFGTLASVSLGLSTTDLWRLRFDPSASEYTSTEWQTLLLNDAEQDQVALHATADGTIRPFGSVPELSASSLEYRLGVRLFQLSLTGADPLNQSLLSLGPGWSSDAVSEHSVNSLLSFSNSLTTDSITLSAQLPPLVSSLTAGMNAAVGGFSAKVQGGFSLPSSGILYQPLIVNGTMDFGSNITASEELQFDLANTALSLSTSQLALGGLLASFVAEEGPTIGSLIPSSMKIGYESTSSTDWFWDNRIKLDFSVKTHWSMNLQNYLDNLFDFGATIGLTIYKFLDFSFNSYSSDTNTYRFIPAWANAEGEAWVNPLVDLAQSFDFFNSADRIRSSFKIRALSVKAVQHMPDWDLSFEYAGTPQLRTDPTDQRLKYIWTPTFSIQVTWHAISEVKDTIKGDYTGVTLR